MQQMAKVLTKGTAGGKQVSKHGGDKRKAMTQLLAIPKSQLQRFFGQCKDCWNKGVVSKGNYFEGD
jgi:hypothetical protein